MRPSLAPLLRRRIWCTCGKDLEGCAARWLCAAQSSAWNVGNFPSEQMYIPLAPHTPLEKVDLRKRSTTATKNYIVETRQGPAPTNVPSEVQCKDRWYVGSLLDQARHQSGM